MLNSFLKCSETDSYIPSPAQGMTTACIIAFFAWGSSQDDPAVFWDAEAREAYLI